MLIACSLAGSVRPPHVRHSRRLARCTIWPAVMSPATFHSRPAAATDTHRAHSSAKPAVPRSGATPECVREMRAVPASKISAREASASCERAEPTAYRF